jgi:WD40 repeat protein
MAAELRGHTAGLTVARFSQDGRQIVTASDDGTARVWDASSGRLMSQLRGHSRAVSGAGFSPDGRFVVTASDDETVQIWVAATGQLLAALAGHGGPVLSVQFAPDGRRIVTAGEDRTVRLYACDVCGGLDDLVGLARDRAARGLTADERSRFLGEVGRGQRGP